MRLYLTLDLSDTAQAPLEAGGALRELAYFIEGIECAAGLWSPNAGLVPGANGQPIGTWKIEP